MSAKTSLATITGTMLVPGVSRNNRLYKADAIGRAVTRMRERLNDPDGLPIVMRTHHDAGDDSRQIVGRVVDVKQEADGSATYRAKLFNNKAGRDLAPLIAPDAEDGKAALRTTSIHGYWVGPTERMKSGDMPVETGNDLEINAIDFTFSPGVTKAQLSSVTFESTEATRDGLDGKTIFESMDVSVQMEQPLPITVKLDGPKIASYLVERAKFKENFPEPAIEHYIQICVGDANGEQVRVCADNLSPDILKQAIKGAAKVVKQVMSNSPEEATLDNADSDDMITDKADIDYRVEMSPTRDITDPDSGVDDTGNGGYNSTMTQQSTAGDSEPNSIEETAMAEDTTATAAPAVEAIDYNKLAATIAETMMKVEEAKAVAKAAKKAAKAKESAKAAEGAVTETNKVGTEVVTETITPEQLDKKLAEERAKTVAELRESILASNGIPQRKGFRGVSENEDGTELTGDALWDKRQDVWAAAYPGFMGASA